MEELRSYVFAWNNTKKMKKSSYIIVESKKPKNVTIIFDGVSIILKKEIIGWEGASLTEYDEKVLKQIRKILHELSGAAEDFIDMINQGLH